MDFIRLIHAGSVVECLVQVNATTFSHVCMCVKLSVFTIHHRNHVGVQFVYGSFHSIPFHSNSNRLCTRRLAITRCLWCRFILCSSLLLSCFSYSLPLFIPSSWTVRQYACVCVSSFIFHICFMRLSIQRHWEHTECNNKRWYSLSPSFSLSPLLFLSFFLSLSLSFLTTLPLLVLVFIHFILACHFYTTSKWLGHPSAKAKFCWGQNKYDENVCDKDNWAKMRKLHS